MKKKNLITATSTNLPAYSTIYCIYAANLSRAFDHACLSGTPFSAPWIIIACRQHDLQKPPD